MSISPLSDILYEDDLLLAINKPTGIPSQPLKPDETNTAVHLALAHCPDLNGVGNNSLEPGLLHRLDVGTSGVLLFAKTNEAFDHFRTHWQSIRKIYRAITQNKPLSIPLTLELPIGHSLKSAKKMVVLTAEKKPRTNVKGKPQAAKTIIHQATQLGGRFDLELEIITGVRHQIRAHLAQQDLSIVGDSRYGGAEANRMYLHAWKLIIPGETPVEITAPLPADWK